MNDQEFEEMWAKAKEHDRRELADLLDLWDSLSIKEKENYVREQEILEHSGIWEDFTPDVEDSGNDSRYTEVQRRFQEEYKAIRSWLKKQGRL